MSFYVRANVVQCELVFLARSAFQLDAATAETTHFLRDDVTLFMLSVQKHLILSSQSVFLHKLTKSTKSIGCLSSVKLQS